jgi:hypothetical protein
MDDIESFSTPLLRDDVRRTAGLSVVAGLPVFFSTTILQLKMWEIN